MLLLRILRRILCIIFIIKATVGQLYEQQQHQQHEFMPYSATPSFLRTLLGAFPYHSPNSLIHKQYESQKPMLPFEHQHQQHHNQHQQQQQTENGNILAAKEIAMEILSEKLPSNTKSFDDVISGDGGLQMQQQQQQQQQQEAKQQPLVTPHNCWWCWQWQRWLNDLSSKQANFRESSLSSLSSSSLYSSQQKKVQQQQEMEKLNSEYSNWHKHTKGFVDLNADFTPATKNDDSTGAAVLKRSNLQSEATHEPNFDDDANADNGDGDNVDEYEFLKNPYYKLPTNSMKATSTVAGNANNDENFIDDSLFEAQILMHKLNDEQLAGEKNKYEIMKRNPLALDDYKFAFAQPHYPFAYYTPHDANDVNENIKNLNHMKLRSSKRERTHVDRTSFLPSISAGAMTNLGSFFGDLSKNVHFNEQRELHEAKAKLLEGDHPLRMLQKEVELEGDENAKIDKTAQFLQAIRSYRPSQRIRSLVSMTPQGYHGSNFLDPNYMWVGLG